MRKWIAGLIRDWHRSRAGRLSVKVAQKFLKDNDAVDLSEFNSIADAAAESLAKHEGDLWLFGLTTLSDAAAKALGKHEGSVSREL